MKIKIENVNVYITKVPSDEGRESVIDYTPVEKALGWENKTPEEIDEIIERMTAHIHDGLESFKTDGTGKEQGLPIPVKTVPTKCDVGCEVKTGDKTEIVFSKFADRTGKDGIETDE